MAKQLTLSILQSQMKPQQRLTVDEHTVKEIQKLAENSDYGEEFLDCYLDHLNIYKEATGRSHQQYLYAIKFFSLVEAGNSLVDAYIKVFPERYTERNANTEQDQSGKDLMRGEASRYNNTMLVNEIRKVAAIPIQLIHRHILHEAILEQAELMRTARSEMVRQKAGATLIAELKPSEEQTLNVNVEDNTTSIIDELRKAAERLAATEYQRVSEGVPLKEIADSVILTVDEDDNSKDT